MSRCFSKPSNHFIHHLAVFLFPYFLQMWAEHKSLRWKFSWWNQKYIFTKSRNNMLPTGLLPANERKLCCVGSFSATGPMEHAKSIVSRSSCLGYSCLATEWLKEYHYLFAEEIEQTLSEERNNNLPVWWKWKTAPVFCISEMCEIFWVDLTNEKANGSFGWQVLLRV